jgi:glycosyltransferase involved in cell wall biosynthesis
VVTIHDLAFRRYPEVLTADARRYFEQATAAAVRRADAIVTVSEQTRQDLISDYGVASDRVYRVYNGVASRFCPGDSKETARERVSQTYGLDTPYIFFLGTLEPRKNAEGLIQAFHRLYQEGLTDLTLVLAGGKGWLYDTIFETVATLDIEDRVRFLDHVPDEDLPDLYRAAQVFAWPSFYEGFGLPVLEAMACGTPVVTSNTSSLPEVTGDAALLVDPHRPDEIASAIGSLFEDQALLEDLQLRGLRQAAQFSWHRCAKQTLDVYHTIAG